MEDIKQMRKRHDIEVENLQENCPHTKLSKWMDECWAPAHGTGFQVKTCNVCGKVVQKQTMCRTCERITEDYKNGLGTYSRPYGSYYCPDCIERSEKEVKEDEEQQVVIMEHIKEIK